MLEVSRLAVAHGATLALHDVSLDVKEHEIVTLIGANGAGKTTLMMAVSGVLKPRAGRIVFRGREIQDLSAHDVARLGVAQVAQQSHLFKAMTVEENLHLGAYRLGRRADTGRTLDQIYAYFPVLGRRKAQRAGSLSGGEQKMLAFGRALMAQPTLLLLDEPSAGLSPKMVSDLARVIRDLRSARILTTLIVEQNAVLALDLADRGYLLESGHVRASGTAKDLLGSDEVRMAYLGM